MLTDSHCHIFLEYYQDIERILKDASSLGVGRVISSAYDLDSCKEALNYASKFSNYYCTLGIHPENVATNTSSGLKFIVDNLNNKNVVAIGEIGLDYYYTKENKVAQKELFKSQLEIAEKYELPVVIHSREATEDTYEILKQYKVKGVIHSFSGSLEMAKKYVELGYVLGVNGVITFKNCKIKEVIKQIGLNNIILETDSPYLTPEPFRGTQNAPKHIAEISRFLAEMFEVSPESIEIITNQNIKRIFDI